MTNRPQGCRVWNMIRCSQWPLTPLWFHKHWNNSSFFSLLIRSLFFFTSASTGCWHFHTSTSSIWTLINSNKDEQALKYIMVVYLVCFPILCLINFIWWDNALQVEFWTTWTNDLRPFCARVLKWHQRTPASIQLRHRRETRWAHNTPQKMKRALVSQDRLYLLWCDGRRMPSRNQQCQQHPGKFNN